MRTPVIILAILVMLILPTAAANINVTVAAKGDTYIQWQWDSGYNLTHILIDGIEICGYETTDNVSIRSNLAPDSLHSINVSTDTDSGNATARTLPDTSGGGASSVVDYSSDATAAAYGVVGGLLTSVLVVKRWKKDS